MTAAIPQQTQQRAISLDGRLVFRDSLTPVVAEGLGHSVAQAQDTPSARTFMVNGAPLSGVSQLGGDLMATYTAGPFQKVGVCVQSPSIGLLWCPTTTSTNTASDDHVYGLPGAAVWETRIGANGGTVPYRLSQRWYSIPGVPDCLFLEVQLSPDWTAAANAFFSQPVNLAVMMETKAGRAEACGGYDSTLDGIGMNGQGASAGEATYTFLRCLTHLSTGRLYTSTLDANYGFGSGTLGSNVDTWTTTSGETYRALLSVQAPLRNNQSRVIFRFALGLGQTPTEAKLATRDVPNKTFSSAVREHESALERYPQLASPVVAERKAWAYHVHSLHFNTRTETDSAVSRDYMAQAGEHVELPINALGRWNNLWTMDTAFGLLGSVHVNPSLVRDTLDYMFNRRMDQSTGFLYYSRVGGSTRVQHGAFMFARLARRYLAHTSDTTFVTALYPKLKLMWEWWTTTASSGYRHPSWPTVKLFTATHETEIQEDSPVTEGGNYPSGCDWTTAMAYDFCVQMGSLATSTGNSGDAATWATWASDLRSALRTYCWDTSQGWFQPTMTSGSSSGGQADSLGRFQQVMTYRAFASLWLGVASPAQAAVMRDKIMDTAIFKGTYGIRTVDRRWNGYSPTNWVNGASRPYFDAAVSVGLRRYGYTTDANAVLELWTTTQNLRGTTPEAIHPEAGTGGYARHLLTGNQLMEAYLAKREPDKLYAAGVGRVTS